MATISALEAKGQSRVAKWGWGILLAVSALLLFNGIMWFFVGPGIDRGGLSLEEFSQAYPVIAGQMADNARQVAIWYMAFGSLALLVTLEGFRRGSRWAWYATWVLVAAPAAVGVLYLAGFGIIMLGLAVVALIAQLLVWKGLSPSAEENGYAK